MWRAPRAAPAARRALPQLQAAGSGAAGPAAACAGPRPGGASLGGFRGLAPSVRYFAGSSGPAAAAASGYPDGSMSQELLDRCMEAAISRGVDVAAPYKPWVPVDLLQTFLVDVHEAAGCSWALAIVLACLGIRLVLLPVSVAATRGSREKALIQPQFVELTEKQRKLSMEGDQEKVAENAKQMQAFQQKHGKFFMLKGTWNLFCFQVPLYVTAFASMRGFASHPDLFRGFAMESPLWLDSLALPDPYGLMPLLTSAIMLTNLEIFGAVDSEVGAAQPVTEKKASDNVAGQGTFQKYQKWIMRGTSLFFIPLTWNFPAGVFIFMCTNMVVGTLQNRLFRWPLLERLLELPPTLEKSQAASKALDAGGPLGLVALGGALPHAKGWELGRPGRPSRALESRAERPRQLAAGGASSVSSSLALVAKAEASRRTLDDLVVSQRFAVTRARSERPLAAQ